jgi:hypothetical protein
MARTTDLAARGTRVHTSPLQRSVVCKQLNKTVTLSTEHSPSREANSRLAGQRIPSLLWNSKVHYHAHKSTSPVKECDQTRGLF